MFTLADFPGWWVSVRCGCGRSAAIPIRLLVQRHGAGAQPEVLARRMRCSGCGARPAEADLVEHAQAGAAGFVGGGEPQRVPLVRGG